MSRSGGRSRCRCGRRSMRSRWRWIRCMTGWAGWVCITVRRFRVFGRCGAVVSRCSPRSLLMSISPSRVSRCIRCCWMRLCMLLRIYTVGSTGLRVRWCCRSPGRRWCWPRRQRVMFRCYGWCWAALIPGCGCTLLMSRGSRCSMWGNWWCVRSISVRWPVRAAAGTRSRCMP